MKTLLVTGSSGLVGSEVATHFHQLGWRVHGADNNTRAELFGPEGDNRRNQRRLVELAGYHHHELDVRDRAALTGLIQTLRPDAVVHTAAQPSHDLAARRPFDDFEINANGTLNLLEALRQFAPQAPLVHLSTNKVYGDAVNRIPLRELATRWEYSDSRYSDGIAEDFPIDQSKHSLFGVSKLAGDLLVQEYGRYFDMPTCCLRAGCITGAAHSAVEQHGFLAYLVKVNLRGGVYRVHGFKGKQVRDNLHARDVALFAEQFISAPRRAEVYNCGGGNANSCSILEAFARVEALTGKPMRWEYSETAREGDQICYSSSLKKLGEHYPRWAPSRSLDDIFRDLVDGWQREP